MSTFIQKIVYKLGLQVCTFSHVCLLMGAGGGEGDGWLGRIRVEHGRQGVHHGGDDADVGHDALYA
jgi:hypothetical protein